MLDFIKKLDKRIIIGGVVGLLLIIVLIIMFLPKKVTDLERIKINEISNKVEYYFSDMTEVKEEDGSYIVYAIDYLSANNDKKQFTPEEVIDVINNTFDVNYNKDKLAEYGLTSYMLYKGIKYDMLAGVYEYQYQTNRSDIANNSLIRYDIKDIKKKNKNEFIVTYSKYVVEEPYKLLNYYTSFETQDDEIVSNITKYLKGDLAMPNVLKYINKDNINTIGRIDKELKITYIIKNDKLVIKKMDSK